MPVEFPTISVPTLFLLGYLVSGGVSVAFAVYIVRFRREGPAARAFAVVSVVLALWAFAYVGRFLSPSLSTKLLWTQLAWVGITISPVAVLTFVLIFTGRSNLVSRKFVASLLVVPILTQFVLLTNDWHALFYEDVWLYTTETATVIASRGGLWFYAVHIPYAWSLYFVATVLLVQFALTTTHIYRSQTLALLFGAIFPWVVNGTFLAGVRIHPELDPTPIGFGVGLAAIAVAVFRVDFLGIIPIARETVVDEVEQCFFVLDDTDRVVDVNEAGEAFLYSYDRTRWQVGDPASEILPAKLWNHELLTEGAPAEAEVSFEMADGDAWYLVRISRIDGTIDSGLILTLTNISAQKRQQVVLERQNTQLERVADVISHDLRNPLSVGTAYLQLLEDAVDGEGLSESARDQFELGIEQIEESHERMDDLIEDVLTLARSGNSLAKTSRVDLESLAREAWLYVDTADVQLVVDGSKTLECDDERLLRVFENLYRNTVSHGGGATTVTVGVIDGGFYVEDDGVGIPTHAHDTVFDRGMTSDTDGTGLGLAIVRTVIGAHEWTVSVTEGTEGGARFEILDGRPAETE